METNFGIRGIPLMLMKRYLSNRRQFTFVQVSKLQYLKLIKLHVAFPRVPLLAHYFLSCTVCKGPSKMFFI